MIINIKIQQCREMVWNLCVIKLLYQASTHNTFYVTQSAILCRPVMIMIKWCLSHDRNHWYSEWHIPWTNTCPPLNISWQNVVSDLYIFDHQGVDISLGSMLGQIIRAKLTRELANKEWLVSPYTLSISANGAFVRRMHPWASYTVIRCVPGALSSCPLEYYR